MKIDGNDEVAKMLKQREEEYLHHRYGYNSPKDVPKAVNMLRNFFPGYSETELVERSTTTNLKTLYDKVIDCFHREYGVPCDTLLFNNLFQKNVVCYLYNDEDFPAFVHVDELLESSILMFLVTVFKWSKELGDAAKCGKCFSFLMFLFNEMAIEGELPDENAKKEMLLILDGDEQILRLVEACYWAIMMFCIAHEVGHYYYSRLGKKYSDDIVQAELFADGVAYHIVLRCIMNNDILLDEYAYLAPLMSLDFLDLYVYMYSLLHGVKCSNGGYPSIEERKEQLLSIVDKDIYQLNTEQGNALYTSFLDVLDEFKKQASEKMEQGYLDCILKNEKDKETGDGQARGN